MGHREGRMGRGHHRAHVPQSGEGLEHDLTSLPCVGDDITVHGGNGWLPHGQGFRVGDVGCHQARRAVQGCRERDGNVLERKTVTGWGHQTTAIVLSPLLLDSWFGTQYQSPDLGARVTWV